MEQPKGVGRTEQEHGHVASFEIALLHERIAHAAGVHHEAIHFRIFLRGALDHFHAIQRFGKMRVHLSKRGADFICDRRKVFQIADQRDEIEEDKNKRHQDQATDDSARRQRSASAGR